ncbi:PREDICTED: transcription factor bHLH128-like [Camelina sativa]|uniref:Transcription factor bHLH128-like n=1 Tax=Camelina sativa TaxID=90675 RepID=A0ABM0WRX8_CAMSA|nr:PREDICTED: transcription factor bHLH128-like [Camelina sativa]
MYQSSSSTSSSSHRSSLPGGGSGGGLIRYGSAPGSFLNSVVDEVIGGSNARDFTGYNQPSDNNFIGNFFAGADSSSLRSDSTTCGVNSSSDGQKHNNNNKDVFLDRSYGGGFNHEISQHKSNELGGGSGSGSGSYSLARQRSSPADFFSYLAADKNNFALNQPTSDYSPQGGSSNAGRGHSRLKSQLSFTSHDSLARINEVNETPVHDGSGHSFSAASFGAAATDSWDDGSGSIGFTVTRPNKRSKDMDSGLFSQYSLPSDTSMNYMDNFMQLPEDSVPCKIRAKRGCATHPRSIAERERRTRISGKLKKLQDLVPNMDKQTSYSDMLDLAVQHIKGLQHQLQNLKKDQENCTCGCSERQS